MKTRTVSSLLAACAVATASFADLTLNVTGTMSFQDAVEAAGSSVAALNGGESKTESIVKTGDGTLTLDVNDLNLSAWEGNFGISNGTVRVTVSADKANTSGILGSGTAGIVTVAPGATIEMYSEVIANAWSFNWTYAMGALRPIHISGTGVAGKGALRLEVESGAIGGAVRTVIPNKLFLDADATISWINRFDSVKDSSPQIDLGGHTLTFSSAYASGSDPVHWVDNTGFTNPGHIVMDGVTYLSRAQTDTWGGDDSNTVTFRNGGRLRWDNNNSRGFSWHVIGEAGSPSRIANDANGDYDPYTSWANWYGPMTLTSTVALHYNNAVSGETDVANKIKCTSLLGKISGTGGFASDSTSSTYNPRWKQTCLNLGGIGNDFTGPLALKGMILGLYSTTAIPPANDNIVLTNCQITVNVTGSLEPAVTRLENIRVVDNGTIDGNPVLSAVSAEKIVKSGAGTLTINLPVDAGRLDISEGTVKLSSISHAQFRSRAAGLYYGYAQQKPGVTHGGYVVLDSAPFNVFLTNSVVRMPTECNTPPEKWMDAYTDSNCVYRTYSGYLWNDEPTPQSWTFLVTFNGVWDLSIGDTTQKKRNPAQGKDNPEPMLCTFTLQPGPNKFDFRVGNYYVSTPNYGNVATNGLVNWTSDRYAWGLAYDTQGRNSMDADCYTPFSEDEPLALFTFAIPSNLSDSKIGTLTGTSSGTLDLDGQTIFADAVEGGVKIVNGTLAVPTTNATTSSTISFGSGRYRISEREASRAANAGLTSGSSATVNAIYSHAQFTANAAYGLYDGTTKLSPIIFFTEPGTWDGVNAGMTGWTSLFYHRFVTYSGYLWNNSKTEKTLHCISTINSYTDFVLSGTKVGIIGKSPDIKRNPEGNALVDPVRFDMTLAPGANAFSIITYDRFGTTDTESKTWLHGNVCTNGLTNWDACHGFMYTEQSGTFNDLSDYTAFVDPGDGSLFTTCLPPDEFESLASLTCVKGTTLDLGTSERTVVTLAGAPTVTNGLLAVTGTWTLTAEDIADADTVADGLTFSAGVVLDVAAASDLVALKPLYNSAPVTIARNFTGTIPAVSQRLGNDGWSLLAENGELKLRYVPRGAMIIVR